MPADDWMAEKRANYNASNVNYSQRDFGCLGICIWPIVRPEIGALM